MPLDAPMPDSLAALIRAVDTADSSPALLTAVQHLAAARQIGALPTLMAALNYNNPGAAVAAVEGLIQLGAAAVPPLLEQLDEHNYTARAWAIRALAGIGDPRGLVTLLGVATADFAPSVRRAAAKGLGMMQWHWFPDQLLEIAQAEALEALLFVAQQDDEWVVRYAAVAGLQALAQAIGTTQPGWRTQIQDQCTQRARQDPSAAVRARGWLALQPLQAAAVVPLTVPLAATETHSPLAATDWQQLLDKLYARKGQERLVLAEGDPRRYHALAVALAPQSDTVAG